MPIVRCVKGSYEGLGPPAGADRGLNRTVNHGRWSGGTRGDRPYWYFYMHAAEGGGSGLASARMPTPKAGIRMIALGQLGERSVIACRVDHRGAAAKQERIMLVKLSTEKK